MVDISLSKPMVSDVNLHPYTKIRQSDSMPARPRTTEPRASAASNSRPHSVAGFSNVEGREDDAPGKWHTPAFKPEAKGGKRPVWADQKGGGGGGAGSVGMCNRLCLVEKG